MLMGTNASSLYKYRLKTISVSHKEIHFDDHTKFIMETAGCLRKIQKELNGQTLGCP